MDGKKDPGKFTVRFNIADPQQRRVVELLNQQGRFKAQFLTNAVLHYVRCSGMPDGQADPKMDSGLIRRIVKDVLAQQQTQDAGTEGQSGTDSESALRDTDRDTIFKTLEAFQQQ